MWDASEAIWFAMFAKPPVCAIIVPLCGIVELMMSVVCGANCGIWFVACAQRESIAPPMVCVSHPSKGATERIKLSTEALLTPQPMIGAIEYDIGGQLV